MKQYLLLFTLLTALASDAQTEKGTWLPGGGISFQTAEGSTAFTINPSLGYFIKNNWAIGTSLVLSIQNDNTVWGIGPFTRIYFGKGEKGKPFAGAGAWLLDDKTDSDVGFNLHGGYAFFLNKSIALEVGADLTGLTQGTVFSIATGFRIHFNRGRSK